MLHYTLEKTKIKKDWEFADSSGDSETTGYYLQLLGIRFNIILSDGVVFPAAIVAVIPWLVIISVVYGWNACICCDFSNNNDNTNADDDNHMYSNAKSKIPSDTRKELLKRLCCINLGRDLCSMLLLFFVIIIFFGAFSDMFDWDQSGFWSLHGGTQALGVLIVASWLFIGTWQIYLGANINTIQKFTRHVHHYENLGQFDEIEINDEVEMQVSDPGTQLYTDASTLL